MFPEALRNFDLAVLTNPLDLGLLQRLVEGSTNDEVRSTNVRTSGFAPRTSPRLKVVYDCLDRYEDFYPEGSDLRALLLERERELLDRADFVFASSQLLVEDKSKIRPAHYLPHGVDVDRFEQGSHTVPADMSSLRHPVVGFVGAIESWLNLDWVKAAAEALPDVTFMMVGDVRCDLGGLDRLPNVRFPGYKPYGVVPSYVANYDVCIIPFRINNLTAAVNPVKALEYFALGKPIVSSYMKELERYLPYLSLVRSSGEFVAAVKTYLTEDRPDGPEARRQIARTRSWRAIAGAFLDVVEDRTSATGF
jgi:glycosyltransferase involved in cell wall biosynthesis